MDQNKVRAEYIAHAATRSMLVMHLLMMCIKKASQALEGQPKIDLDKTLILAQYPASNILYAVGRKHGSALCAYMGFNPVAIIANGSNSAISAHNVFLDMIVDKAKENNWEVVVLREIREDGSFKMLVPSSVNYGSSQNVELFPTSIGNFTINKN